MSITFNGTGFSFNGFGGVNRQCDFLNLQWESREGRDTRAHQYLPPKYHFRAESKVELRYDCEDTSLYDDEQIASLFNSHFEIYFVDEGAIFVFEAQHGPGFILEPVRE